MGRRARGEPEGSRGALIAGVDAGQQLPTGLSGTGRLSSASWNRPRARGGWVRLAQGGQDPRGGRDPRGSRAREVGGTRSHGGGRPQPSCPAGVQGVGAVRPESGRGKPVGAASHQAPALRGPGGGAAHWVGAALSRGPEQLHVLTY